MFESATLQFVPTKLEKNNVPNIFNINIHYRSWLKRPRFQVYGTAVKIMLHTSYYSCLAANVRDSGCERGCLE